MAMKPSDPIAGAARATAAATIAALGRLGVPASNDTAAYLPALEAACQAVGFDFAILAAQWANETDYGRSAWWTERRNPAGLGITGDPKQNAASPTFRTPEIAAAAHVAHMTAYVYGAERGNVKAADDPRWQAVFAAGYAGKARTLADLAGKWAADPNYAGAICAKAAALWPKLPDAAKGDSMPDKPSILIVAGHRNTTGGNQEEASLTPAMARQYRDAFRAAGFNVTYLQDNAGDSFNGNLDDVGKACLAWAQKTPGDLLMLDCHYEGEAASVNGCFAIPPDERGLTALAPGGNPGNDTWDNNPLDVSLARAIAKGISAATGLPLRTVGVAEPGVMSERQTGVGLQGYRLAMFGWTAPVRDRMARLVVEHGNHYGSIDRGIIFQDDFTNKCAPAVVAAVHAVYGLGAADPKPQPAPKPGKEPSVKYPKGMDAGVAAWAFGALEKNGKRYAFAESDPLSAAWLKYGAQYGLGEIRDVWAIADGRLYVKFDGFTLWRPNSNEPFAPLGVA